MTQTSPGWYPDPNGRFAQRYHDGTNWTEHVADAAGNRTVDPQGAAPGAAPAATGFGGGGAGGQAIQTGGTFSLTVGFVASAVGALFVVLSLLALDWAEASFEGFSSSSSLGDIGEGEGDVPIFVDLYSSFLRWLGILFAIAVAVVASKLVKVQESIWRIAGFVGIGFAAWHLIALVQTAMWEESGIEIKTTFGTWLGLLGWLGVLVPLLADRFPQLQADRKLGN